MENQEKSDFEKYKINIMTALENKFKSGEIKLEENVTLVDGFVMQSIQSPLNGIQLGGKSIPMIMLIGNKSGRAYYFALKAILPNIEI